MPMKKINRWDQDDWKAQNDYPLSHRDFDDDPYGDNRRAAERIEQIKRLKKDK